MSKKDKNQNKIEYFAPKKSIFALLFVFALFFELVLANLSFVFCVLPNMGNKLASETTIS